MKNSKGFTLIEVVVSLAIIGIMAVSMLTIFNSGLTNIVRAGARTETVTKAEYNMNILGNEETYVEYVINLPTTPKDKTTESDKIVNIKTYKVTGNHTTSYLGRNVSVEIFQYIPDLGSE